MNNYRIESDCVTQFAQEYAINVSFINYHGTVERFSPCRWKKTMSVKKWEKRESICTFWWLHRQITLDLYTHKWWEYMRSINDLIKFARFFLNIVFLIIFSLELNKPNSVWSIFRYSQCYRKNIMTDISRRVKKHVYVVNMVGSKILYLGRISHLNEKWRFGQSPRRGFSSF